MMTSSHAIDLTIDSNFNIIIDNQYHKRTLYAKFQPHKVPVSGKLTHSAGRLAAGLRLNAGSTAGRKLLLLWEFLAFVLRYCL